MGRASTAVLLGVLLLLLLLLPSGASAAPADERLAAVDSWAFALGDSALDGDLTERYRGYGLVVVDGEELIRRQAARIGHAGAIVLAYLNVGAIERWRSWYGQVRRYRLDYWDDWGEWYADVARDGYRRVIERRVAPAMLAKGVDGLFLDNVDMIETHPRQARGMRLLVARLARSVHARGGLLFTQNGDGVIGPMLRHLDGWNREDVAFTYDFEHRRYRRVDAVGRARAQRELRRIASHGLLTLATSYTAGPLRDRQVAVDVSCAAGALPFVSNISLTRVGRPLGCR